MKQSWSRWLLTIFGLTTYLSRLSSAFGWRYLAAVILTYGINQGSGETFIYGARKYFLMDEVGMDAAQFGRLVGAAQVPWQLKSLFGLLSDTVPLFGRQRAPYMVLAGSLGLGSALLLSTMPPAAFTPSLALLLLLFSNASFAVPDVMLDATVAERCRLRPDLAAELQALCSGSFGVFSAPSALVVGVMVERVGAQPVFFLFLFCALAVVGPPLLGWLGERRRPGEAGLRACPRAARQLCCEVWTVCEKRNVASAALVVGLWAIVLSTLQNALAHELAVGVLTVVGNFGMCLGIGVLLRRVDGTLARAAVFAFLQGALCPSSRILFEWAHDPGGGGDNRCFGTERCAAAANASAADAAELAAAAAASASAVDGTSVLPCGWSRARQQPCVSPFAYSCVDVVGSASMALGAALYTSVFKPWPYRRIITTTQVALVAVNFLDLLWVSRLNRSLGVPDVAFLFGDEVLARVVHRLNTMPFLIFAAKLCPASVEASMFALFMGLSNFGSAAGDYLGSGLLHAFGGVKAPEYDHLVSYVATRSALRALPLLLVPHLVPRGSPADSAAAMGAAFAGAEGGNCDEAEARFGTGGTRGTGTLELMKGAEPSQQVAATRAKVEPAKGAGPL